MKITKFYAKVLSLLIIFILSGCSAIGVVTNKAQDLSSSVTDAAMNNLCAMMRLKDYERIFRTVELKKHHKGICDKDIKLAE